MIARTPRRLQNPGMLPVRYDSSQRQPESLVLPSVVQTPVNTRSILGLLPILFFCLAASRRPSTSTADANQPTPTSTNYSTPTLQVPARVAARTPQAPPPQPLALAAVVIRLGTVFVVRLQPAPAPKTGRREEDDWNAIRAQSGRVNGQTIVHPGKGTAIGSGVGEARSQVLRREGERVLTGWQPIRLLRGLAVSDAVVVSSAVRPTMGSLR